LSSLLIQLEGVVDAIQTPSPVMLTSPPVNYDIFHLRSYLTNV
jgi:hypothetical protein